MDVEKKNSLLLVDDENTNLKVLTHILGSTYTIYTAPNGSSAVEKANEYLPDLILLDILMPEMDGYQTILELKKNDVTRKIPVIFITGLNSDEDEEKGLSLEAADYITKPFNAVLVKLRVRNQIQIVNQMRTIEKLSLQDQLTNLPNRRSFDERLNMEWRQSIREQTPISILMIDVDKFKNLNDTYGHPQGDIVLQKIADIIPASFKRAGDFAARWGGEEFVVLLPNTHLHGALEIAEKIRADIADTRVSLTGGLSAQVTVSVGVNTQEPTVNSNINEFVSSVDKALYAAKDAGRNKVASCEGVANL